MDFDTANYLVLTLAESSKKIESCPKFHLIYMF